MKKVQVEGQLSLWDIEIPKKEISFTKIDEKVTKMDHSFTKVTPGGTVEGDIDFKTETLTPILPIDKILYSKNDELINEIQKKVLLRLKSENNVKQVIKRYGDKNYIVITDDETLSINPKGWILNFKSEAIFNENEIIKDKVIEVGDTVKVEYGGKEHLGKVVHIYGPGNCTLNVVFDNKHTAFFRGNVKIVC